MDFKQLFESTGIFEGILLVLFLTTLLIQCFYYFGVYLRLPTYKPGKRRNSTKGISVVICARNEANNLERFLPLILEQNYPKFEVVVVNDCSTDHTEELLSELKVTYEKLRYTNIPLNEKFAHGKKLALTIGLKSAQYDHVLLTDADCYPTSKGWLQSMAGNLGGDKEIVLGYGSYEKQKGLLNIIIRYETVFTAIQYFSFAIKGRPYMGVGRNLAYRRDIFFRNKGFASHYELASGDDDLFINEVVRGTGTRIEIHEESHTISESKRKWKEWYYQKKRHLTTGPRYKPATKFLLGTEILSRIFFYASFILLLTNQDLTPHVLGVFFIRMLSTLIVIKLAMTRLNEKYLLLISPFMDFTLPWVHIWMVFSNYVASKRARWI